MAFAGGAGALDGGAGRAVSATPGPAGPVWLPRPVLPMVGRLRTGTRLGALIAALLVPALVATWAFTGVIGGQIAFAARERTGLAVLRPALGALVSVVAGRPPELDELGTAVRNHPELALARPYAAVREAANAAEPPRAARVKLARALVDLTFEISNAAGFLLDPDRDFLHVMNIAAGQIPRAIRALAQSAAAPEASGGAATAAALAVRAGELSNAATAIRADLARASAHTALARLPDRLASVTPAADAIEAAGVALEAGLPVPAASPALADAVASTVADVTSVLDDLLAARITRLSDRRTAVLAVTLLGLLLASWLAAAVWRRRSCDRRRPAGNSSCRRASSSSG